jgi:hypothetical protein
MSFNVKQPINVINDQATRDCILFVVNIAARLQAMTTYSMIRGVNIIYFIDVAEGEV